MSDEIEQQAVTEEIPYWKARVKKYLAANLDIIKEKVRTQDTDYIIVIEGYEGYGKSTLACDIADYCEDGNFDIEKVIFDENDFMRFMNKTERCKVMWIDEGDNLLSAKDTMTSQTKDIEKTFKDSVRGLNLIVIINCPRFLDLVKYMKKHRARVLIKLVKKGYYAFYSPKRTKQYVIRSEKESKNKHMKPPSPNFIERFTKRTDEKWLNYYTKKMLRIKQHIKDRAKNVKMYDEQLDVRDASLMSGISEDRIIDYIQIGKIKAEIGKDGEYIIPRTEIERMRDEEISLRISLKKKKRRALHKTWY